MKYTMKLLAALLLAAFVPSFCLAVGAFDVPALLSFLQTPEGITAGLMAAAPLIVIGQNKYTLTQAVDQRGKLIQERNQILDAPAETRGEGEAAVAELSEEQRTRLTGIDSEVRQLDTRIEEARERIRLDQEQRDLEEAARRSDVRYAPDPARSGPSRGEQRDIAQFSLGRALRMASEGRSLDGVEAEMVEEGLNEARASGISPQSNGIIVSSMALSQGEQRDHSVGTPTAGGNLVQTNVGTLLDALFERLVFNRLGADVMTGMVGNYQINRIVRGTAPASKAENAAADEYTATFHSITLTPTRVPTYLDISNQLFIQSQERNLERRITRHVLSELRVVMEKAYVATILGTSGIGDVAGDTNGAAPTYADIVNIAGKLTDANVDPDGIQYLINSAVESYLMQAPLTVDSSSEPVGDGKILPSGAQRLAGRNFETSNVVPSDLDKGTSTGVCSAIIAGDFSGFEAVQWGGMEFLIDPFTQATTGQRRVHVAVYHDGDVNDPAKFSAMQDALTA